MNEKQFTIFLNKINDTIQNNDFNIKEIADSVCVIFKGINVTSYRVYDVNQVKNDICINNLGSSIIVYNENTSVVVDRDGSQNTTNVC
jgi:hypothetical protein